MKTSDFDYSLPEELIAQQPLDKRDSSRLLILDKATGKTEHKIFTDIIDYLDENDLLVLNSTRVLHKTLGKQRRYRS
jgi:S-adenosylmethionine:tRNA ribosyltransferase-isomerase